MSANQTYSPAARYAVLYSGGKDSTLALDRALRAGAHVVSLVTLYDGETSRVRFHGTPIEVMRAQAEALNLRTALYPTSQATFERIFITALRDLTDSGVNGLILGDIHLADVRGWYEERVRAAGLEHIEPLWGEDPAALAAEVVARGYEAIVTCIEEARADPAWLGRPLTTNLLSEFAARGIDVCGERGEYHTLVIDGPLFAHRMPVAFGATHAEAGFRQLDTSIAQPD